VRGAGAAVVAVTVVGLTVTPGRRVLLVFTTGKGSGGGGGVVTWGPAAITSTFFDRF